MTVIHMTKVFEGYRFFQVPETRTEKSVKGNFAQNIDFALILEPLPFASFLNALPMLATLV